MASGTKSAPKMPTARRGRVKSLRNSARSDRSRKRAREGGDSNEYTPGEENDNEEDTEEGEDEEVNPDGKKSVRKLYSCPFSDPRDGALALCKWPPHADKRSVRFCWRAFADYMVVGETSSRDSFHRFSWRNKI